MTQTVSLYSLAGVLFVLFLVVGSLAARFGPGQIDAVAAGLRGKGTKLALFFTYSGRGPFLTAALVLAIGIFAVVHAPLWVPVLITGSQLVTQGLSNLFKRYYARMRPEYWLEAPERGHAYPSGHAVTAVVFYLGWAIVCAFAPFAPHLREALIVLLIVWAIGIDWSRLALGAHYLTDVIGGTLLGFAWLCALTALFEQIFQGH